MPGEVDGLHVEGERTRKNAFYQTPSVSVGERVADGRGLPVKLAFLTLRVFPSLPCLHPSTSSLTSFSPTMPLTRQHLRSIDLGNSRILRSGGRPRALLVSRHHGRRQGQVGRRDAPRSLLPVIPGFVDGVAAPEQPQRPEAEGNAQAPDVPGRLHITSRIRYQPLSLQHPGPLEENSRSVLDSAYSAAALCNAAISPEVSLPVTTQSLLSDTVDPTDAGAPTDGT